VPSLIVTLLAERPTEELEALRQKAHAERARVEVELQQFEEALALKARRGPRQTRTTAAKPGGTRKRVLDAVASSPDPISPAQVIAKLREAGSSPSGGAIHNMLARLIEAGDVAKVADGQYTLASRNGTSNDAEGPSRNGTTEPLSTVTGPQEGDSE
jgi:hypothetical protein